MTLFFFALYLISHFVENAVAPSTGRPHTHTRSNMVNDEPCQTPPTGQFSY